MTAQDPNHRLSVFSVPKMDCPAEENLIRMALEKVQGITSLSFDLSQRQVTVIHAGEPAIIYQKMKPLGLGARLLESTPIAAGDAPEAPAAGDAAEAKTLWALLAINALMFVAEMGVGLFAQSTGLIADSLDMFADAAVYGLALYAVGRAARFKVRAAHVSGWLQLLLALGALGEVLRRFMQGSEPVSALMMAMGLVALVANIASLYLVSRKKDRGAHMKASYIFSANDVIANLGVIVAGGLVAWTGSPYPDLVIGTLIGLVVLNGARRILQIKG